MNDLEYIRSRLTQANLWGQLAEECTELAQAALKMQRMEQGANMPRKDRIECMQAVIEEHADVALCFEMLNWQDKEPRQDIREIKIARWAEHLKKEENQAFENGREFGRWEAEQGRPVAHWQLFEHESYEEIGCSRCGFTPWRCTTLYPNHEMMSERTMELIRMERKYCQICGSVMNGEQP